MKQAIVCICMKYLMSYKKPESTDQIFAPPFVQFILFNPAVSACVFVYDFMYV